MSQSVIVEKNMNLFVSFIVISIFVLQSLDYIYTLLIEFELQIH